MSKKPAGRLGDMGSSHGAWHPSPAVDGSPDVSINGRPALRMGDALAPHVKPKSPPHGRAMAEGFSSILINGKPACAVGHSISCGGKLSTGSPNVWFGNNPQLAEPDDASLPDIDFSDRRRSGSSTQKHTVAADTPPASKAEPESDKDANPPALEKSKQRAMLFWSAKKNSADNFPEYLAAHLMGLNAETGYSIAEGLKATFETVTDWDQFKGLISNIADGVIDTVNDPAGAYQEVKAAAEAFSQLPPSEQGDALYKASVGLLSGGASAKVFSKVGRIAKGKHELESTGKKRFSPTSLADAEYRLQQRRAHIAKNGYTPKYSDKELDYLAHAGDIGEERFQVRFMESRHLYHYDTPDEYLSGTMGLTMAGASGKGAKYWSTSFDQIEDADTDPKLLSEKLGLDYNEKADYSLVIVDTEKSIPLTGVKSVPATFGEVGHFANTELPDDFSKSFIDKAMTPEFQAEYAKHYRGAVESGDLPDKWSKDTKKFGKYLKSTGMSKTEVEIMKKRMVMHEKIGNNQDYLGNGLTKDNIADSGNQFGAVETLNFERKEINLKQLNDAGAIKIIQGLKPL